MDDFEQNTNAFHKWLLENGVEISSKLAFHDFRPQNQGRGLIATDNIGADELLFKIPRSTTIAVENDLQFMEAIDYEELGPWLSLIAYLMSLQNSTHWMPYFNVLPKSFNTPMFWSSFDALEGSALIDKIGREQAEKEYTENIKPLITQGLFSDVDTSLAAFHRMGSTIMSYSFDIESKDGEPVKAMVPLADTLNAHTKLCNAHLCHPDEDGYLEMRSIKQIPKGSQIYNSYGELPNSDLLRRYGYVEAGGTEYDVVEISSLLIAKATASEYKFPETEVESRLEALEEYDEDGDIYDESYDIPFTGEPEQATLALLLYLQLCAHTQYDIKQTIRQIGNLVGEDKITEEAKAIWEKTIELRLAEYPQELVAKAKEDVTESNETITEPLAMAHEVLIGEIRILHRSLEWVAGMPTVPSGPIFEKLSKKRNIYSNGESSESSTASSKHQRT